MYLRTILPALALYVTVAFSCIVLAAVPACTSNQRQKTLRASLVAVNAAADGFVAWDKQHLHEIAVTAASREDGESKIAAYENQRKPIVESFEVVYKALAVAATQTDDLSLRKAVSASMELVDAINKLRGTSQ